MTFLDFIILWIHIFFAIIFVGGSFFIWIVVWPASFDLSDDPKERTRIVGRIAKRFAYFTHISVAILIVTGIYNATWYLNDNIDELFTTPGGRILLVKIILVGVALLIIYTNNMYHGKRIMQLSKEGKHDAVQRMRKVTHLFSFISLALLLIIVGLATALQFY
jgi:uncharacterized membrane protein